MSDHSSAAEALGQLETEAAATGRTLQAAVFRVHRLDHWILLRGELAVDRTVETADAVLRGWAVERRHGLRYAEQRRPGVWVVVRIASVEADATTWGGLVAHQVSALPAFRQLTHLTQGLHLLSMAVTGATVAPGDQTLGVIRRLTMDVLSTVDRGIERDGRDLCDVEEILSSGALSNVVQPIVRLDGSGVLGYEVLTRGPRGHRLESPLRLFGAASDSLLAAPLEAAAIDGAMSRVTELKVGERIFVNVDPVLAADPRFADHLGVAAERAGARPEQVVIELVERTPLDGLGSFAETLARYRRLGYAIAIDDVGAAHSSLQRIVSLHPDVLKVDRSLIAGCDRDSTKRAMLGFLTQLGWSIDAQVLAEGVETVGELDVVRDLGMDLIQGYLIGRPGMKMAPLEAEAQGLLAGREQPLTLMPHARGALARGAA